MGQLTIGNGAAVTVGTSKRLRGTGLRGSVSRAETGKLQRSGLRAGA